MSESKSRRQLAFKLLNYLFQKTGGKYVVILVPPAFMFAAPVCIQLCVGGALPFLFFGPCIYIMCPIFQGCYFFMHPALFMLPGGQTKFGGGDIGETSGWGGDQGMEVSEIVPARLRDRETSLFLIGF